ncbi:hypothetical protein HK101_002183, partial [Irineochytrium annulatum]
SIPARAPGLRTLVLAHTLVTGSDLLRLLRLLQGLQGLDVSYCPRVTERALIRICERVRNRDVAATAAAVGEMRLAMRGCHHLTECGGRQCLVLLGEAAGGGRVSHVDVRGNCGVGGDAVRGFRDGYKRGLAEPGRCTRGGSVTLDVRDCDRIFGSDLGADGRVTVLGNPRLADESEKAVRQYLEMVCMTPEWV